MTVSSGNIGIYIAIQETYCYKSKYDIIAIDWFSANRLVEIRYQISEDPPFLQVSNGTICNGVVPRWQIQFRHKQK